MSGVIGSLTVRVLGDLGGRGGFATGMKKGKQELKGFRAGVSKTSNVLGVMKKAALGVGAAVGVMTAGKIFLGIAQDIDHIAKTSDKLGIATDRLVGLHHAAEQTGVSTDKLEMSMQRATRRIAEAAQGKGEAKDALKELNLEADRLMKMSPDRVLGEIADKMALVENQGDKVRLSMKLFDSEGVDLVNTLALGSDGLERMQKEAKELGLTLSRTEAAQLEKFNDELDKLTKFFKGVGRQIVIDVAPAAIELVGTLQQLMNKTGLNGKGGGTLGRMAKGFDIFGIARQDRLDGVAMSMAGGLSAKRLAEIENRRQRGDTSFSATGKISMHEAQMRAARAGLKLQQAKIAKETHKSLNRVGSNLVQSARTLADVNISVGMKLFERSKQALIDHGEQMNAERAVERRAIAARQAESKAARDLEVIRRRGPLAAVQADSGAGFEALRRNMRPDRDIARSQLDELKQVNANLERFGGEADVFELEGA